MEVFAVENSTQVSATLFEAMVALLSAEKRNKVERFMRDWRGCFRQYNIDPKYKSAACVTNTLSPECDSFWLGMLDSKNISILDVRAVYIA